MTVGAGRRRLRRCAGSDDEPHAERHRNERRPQLRRNRSHFILPKANADANATGEPPLSKAYRNITGYGKYLRGIK
jgi:hypothetical protein